MRVLAGVVTIALIAVTFWVVAYANDLVVTVVPPLWLATTLGLALLYRRLASTSPDKAFVLQLMLLLASFTCLFLSAYVPARLEWLQVLIAGAMVVPLGALIWVRRHQHPPGS
jgi:hypothetical protein